MFYQISLRRRSVLSIVCVYVHVRVRLRSCWRGRGHVCLREGKCVCAYELECAVWCGADANVQTLQER